MLKFFISLLSLSILFSSALFAEDELAYCGNYVPRPSYLCCNDTYETGCCDPIFTIWGDYLYWEWKTDAITYAVVSSLLGSINILNQEVKRIDPKFRSGFRIGAQYRWPYVDCWDLSIEWTHLISEVKDRVTVSIPEFIYPIWLNPLANPVVTTAAADYHFKLNLLDIDLGRTYCVTQTLSLHPFAGFRAAWIDQDIDIVYSGGDVSPQLESKNGIDFKGYGARFGLDTKWCLCYGLSLFANSSLDILWSNTHVRQKEERPDGSVRNSIKDHICSFTPVFEIFTGVSWEYCLSCWCLSSINAHVGWEQQYFLDLVQLNQYTADGSPLVSTHKNGGLGVGGFVIGVGAGF